MSEDNLVTWFANLTFILLCTVTVKLTCFDYITWAGISATCLVFSVIPNTISTPLLSRNLGSIPLLGAIAARYRASFPCAPRIPGTVDQDDEKIVIDGQIGKNVFRLNLGRDLYCRVGFQYHFQHNQHLHVELYSQFCSYLGCHYHNLQSKFPIHSMNSRYSFLE